MTLLTKDNICNNVAGGVSEYVNGQTSFSLIDDDENIKNNLCKPMLKSICKTGAGAAAAAEARAAVASTEEAAAIDPLNYLNEYKEYAHDYYLKCLDKDTNRNEFKDINDIKYKYDKIKQQNIDSDLRKKSNELFNYLIVFFIILFFIIIFTIIKFLNF